YYDQIPDTIPNVAYDQIADPNQRFWKEYIDFALGLWRDPYGTVRDPGTPPMSYGPDFTWGTIQIKGPQAGLANGPPNGTGTWNRIEPLDNPKRPRHRLWFGPLTMVQHMTDTGLLPGNAHDVSMFPAKLGVAGALQDIQNNHPNDLVSM